MPYDVDCGLEEKQGKHNTNTLITTLSELEQLMKEKNWGLHVHSGSKEFVITDESGYPNRMSPDNNYPIGWGSTIQEAIGRALS